MTITSEQLAAYADGELDDLTAARVRRAVDADPALASELARQAALRNLLAARFDPVLAQPVPERLIAPIEAAAKVVSLSDVRAARQSVWQRPQFRFAAGSAIAATLVIAVLVGRPVSAPAGYADGQLAAALDGVSSGQTGLDGTKLLLSFRTNNGTACRGFAGKSTSGIACHDARGWKLEAAGAAGPQQTAQYQQAGSADAAIMAAAQDMAAGPALDAAAEQAARATGWKPAQ